MTRCYHSHRYSAQAPGISAARDRRNGARLVVDRCSTSVKVSQGHIDRRLAPYAPKATIAPDRTRDEADLAAKSTKEPAERPCGRKPVDRMRMGIDWDVPRDRSSGAWAVIRTSTENVDLPLFWG